MASHMMHFHTLLTLYATTMPCHHHATELQCNCRRQREGKEVQSLEQQLSLQAATEDRGGGEGGESHEERVKQQYKLWQLMHEAKDTKDGTGRLLGAIFEELPSREVYPDYCTHATTSTHPHTHPPWPMPASRNSIKDTCCI